EVAPFSDPMRALDALDGAQTVELLITRVQYPAGKPTGIVLARMARWRRPQIRILMMAVPEAEPYLGEDWGEHLPLPATTDRLVEAARKAFAVSPNSN